MRILNNKDSLLPCLQSVGPWWTAKDRKLLFIYLKKTFGFDSSYLASLLASKGNDGGVDYKLTESEIEDEYNHYLKNSGVTKYSCACLRELSFSFGKINPKLCFLCPYNRTYKNNSQADEYRLIYHLIKQGIPLRTYITNDAFIKKAFLSYFPAYVSGVLVDAYPFYFFIERAIEMELFSPERDLDSFRAELLAGVREDVLKKVKYLRLKPKLEILSKDYEHELMSSVDAAFLFLLESNSSARHSDKTLLRRLFNQLKDRKAYCGKKPGEYSADKAPAPCSDLFANKLAEANEIEELKNPSPNLTVDSIVPDIPVSTDSISTPETSPVVPKVESISTPLRVKQDKIDVEAEEVSGNEPTKDKVAPWELSLNDRIDLLLGDAPVFGEPRIKPQEEPRPDVPDEPVSVPVVTVTSQESIDTPEEPPIAPLDPLPADLQEQHFRSFYELEISDSIFSYGSAGEFLDQTIFESFISESEWFCMEPVVYDGREGVLICNGREKVFYCISDYGPKPVRNISDTSLQVYTSNAFMLAKFLFKNRIYELNLKDVGAASSLQGNKEIHGISDFSLLKFPECMGRYRDIYESAVSSLSSAQVDYLLLFEEYIKLLITDGSSAPFTCLDGLYKTNGSLSLSYLYDEKMVPLISGRFASVNIGESCRLNADHVMTNFMKVCIELNKRMPFSEGNIYILNISSSSLLLYLTGSKTFMDTCQLYLSSCSRRIFSKDADGENVILEEFSIPFEPSSPTAHD